MRRKKAVQRGDASPAATPDVRRLQFVRRQAVEMHVVVGVVDEEGFAKGAFFGEADGFEEFLQAGFGGRGGNGDAGIDCCPPASLSNARNPLRTSSAA